MKRQRGGANVMLLIIMVSICVTLGLAFVLSHHTVSAVDETLSVAREEYGARASLKKYVWMKAAYSQLMRKRADISIKEGQIKEIEDRYKGQLRSDWSTDDTRQQLILSQELGGLKSSYNDLAAQYDAASDSINWAFIPHREIPQKYER